jgi:hypothetical protein
LRGVRGRSPTAEAEDLKSSQCGFESHRPYWRLSCKRTQNREGRGTVLPLLAAVGQQYARDYGSEGPESAFSMALVARSPSEGKTWE